MLPCIESSVDDDDDERIEALEFDLGGSLKENFIGGVPLCVLSTGTARSASSSSFEPKANTGVICLDEFTDDKRWVDDRGLDMDNRVFDGLTLAAVVVVVVAAMLADTKFFDGMDVDAGNRFRWLLDFSEPLLGL